MDFLLRERAVWLTHGSAIAMTLLLFSLLLFTPFWIAFLPGVLLMHRIGTMMHEYIHGIPFRRYKHCLRVLALFDSLMLMFGLLEIFRGTHLAHHRWLNSPGDSGFDNQRVKTDSTVKALETTQYMRFYREALQGRHPYVRPSRILLCAMLSCAWIAFWIAIGRGDVAWKLIALTAFTSTVHGSLRGTIEHHAVPGHEGFANEYRTLIPLFNLNRHIHHHEEPNRPWYLLQYRTPEPLAWHHYYTYWFRTYFKKELVRMRPMKHVRNRSH